MGSGLCHALGHEVLRRFVLRPRSPRRAFLTPSRSTGHSDALSGTLSVQNKDDWAALWHIRTYTGASVGSLEAWLILRSIRTLALVRFPSILSLLSLA